MNFGACSLRCEFGGHRSICAGHYFLAEADLQHAVAMFEAVLDQATDGALSYRQLIKALRMLGLLRDSYGQYVEAETAFRLAMKHTTAFAADYPESAAQARELDALPGELATVVGHQGRISEAIKELETWVTIAQESVGQQFTPVQQLRLLHARCGLSQLFIDGNQLTEAREQVEIAALITKGVAETHASEFELWNNFQRSTGKSRSVSEQSIAMNWRTFTRQSNCRS